MSAGNEREFIDHLQQKEKGGKAMKCPLFGAEYTRAGDFVHMEKGDCLKEECAWWVKENNACSVLTLAQGSTYIHKVLLTIASKMPHEEQFRR